MSTVKILFILAQYKNVPLFSIVIIWLSDEDTPSMDGLQTRQLSSKKTKQSSFANNKLTLIGYTSLATPLV